MIAPYLPWLAEHGAHAAAMAAGAYLILSIGAFLVRELRAAFTRETP